MTSTPPAHLTVIDPPMITFQPTNVVALEGDNVSFSIATTGTMPQTYQWYFNHDTLPLATAASLSLTSVSTADAGEYYVTATNAAGVATSSTATLSVYTTTVPVLTITLSNDTAVVGLVGVPTYTYAIEGSTDLFNWDSLKTNTSPFSITITNVTQSGSLFYRGVYQQ